MDKVTNINAAAQSGPRSGHSKPKNQALLTNKALSILVAMGVKKRPKTIKKLENALNVPSCAKVTPYMNPFDALDIVNKLSETETRSFGIQNGIKYIYASKSEVDERVWELAGAATSTAISGKTIAVPTEQISRKYYETITQRMCSWLSANQEGEKQKLLDEFATRAIMEVDCQPQEVVDNLMKEGIILVNGENVVYSFPEDKIKIVKDILQSQVVDSNNRKTCTSRCCIIIQEWGADHIYYHSKYLPEDMNSSDSDSFPLGSDILTLRALMVLYEMPELKRPNKISELLKELTYVSRLTYVVPTDIFEDQKFKNYVRVLKVKTKGRKCKPANEEKMAIGTNGLIVESIQLTPTGLLGTKEETLEEDITDKPSSPAPGASSETNSSENSSRSPSPVVEKMICQRSLERSQAMAEHKDSMKRRKSVTRGKNICQTFVKTANFIAQKRNSTLVEANKEEKIEMINNVENWVASFQNGMDVEESQLPSLKDIYQQLCRLCIGKVRVATPSSLVLQLQKMGWLTISESSPYHVTYNLPNTRKNSPWVAAAEQVMKKTRMFYLPYLKTMLPSDKSNQKSVLGKRKPERCYCPKCLDNQRNQRRGQNKRVR